jgi:predicted nucleic acid-binding protein
VSGFLLDTNIVSELIKPRPEIKLAKWIEATDEALLFLSVLTIGEIRKGIASHPDPRRRAKLEAWLVGDLQVRFAGRVLRIDAAIAERWGRLAAEEEKAGRPIAVIDGLLAATAEHHDLTFVTRNTADLPATGLSLFNPWID